MSEIAPPPEPNAEEVRLAIERLLDETVDRDESFELEVEDLEVTVPLRFGQDSPKAKWGLNGRVTVTVDGIRAPLREWIEIHEDRLVEDPAD
ncbi:hypothetical protein ACFQJ5_08010 [Halomicroarcula sp. GCM10025324]|uniref:hypothetical protein n=1 Tax=Haloarcula TaxID=2237 RepID=UPI0023E77AA9|nr:hypothetical protein [Halomicroarcula sp. ZS-22-S1]